MKFFFLIIVSSVFLLSNTKTKEIFTVTATDLNVRSGVGSYYSITGKLHYGDEVELIERSNENWYYIRFLSTQDNSINKTGYVYSKYLKPYRSLEDSLPNSNGLLLTKRKEIRQ